jgi:hypothetical protein
MTNEAKFHICGYVNIQNKCKQTAKIPTVYIIFIMVPGIGERVSNLISALSPTQHNKFTMNGTIQNPAMNSTHYWLSDRHCLSFFQL